jgi:subtilisin family serine protease
MKPIRTLLLGAFALGLAGAPAAHAQAALPDTSPANWWLLEARDGFPGIAAERAFRELLAGRAPRDTIVVAIIDSGVETVHPALVPYLWRNPGEVPGNGTDDDANGYVDDVHGWSFLGGPDGRNVEHDTYEVTRLYARMRPRWEGARADTLPPEAAAEWELWQRVRHGFTTRRDEERSTLQQVRQIEGMATATEQALARALGGREPTPEAVEALTPATPQLQQARQIYLQLAELGYTSARIREERESMEERLRYSLDPEFDPRGIVGDDYADGTQRVYGNNDYAGPDATHGTHVAGIVTAVAGRGTVAGGGPAVRIMTLRAVPDGDERDKDVANAIRYAVDNGARVVNMSFGKAFSPEKHLVDDAVRYAESRGVLLVHAAGNDGADLAAEPSFPVRAYRDGGSAGNWIEVGASSWQPGEGLAAPFSNWGAGHVDVFAPGVAILSTVLDGGFDRHEGTSMAAPVVSGIAATVLSYFPELSPAQVKQVILQSATPLGDAVVIRPGTEDERVPFSTLSATGGVANLYEALRLAERMSRGAR